jgi:hypothetical protein
MQTTDVVIHVEETVDHDRCRAIADIVRAQPGVTDVAHHDAKPHLMDVIYDPLAVSAHTLLEIVRDQGVHAELAGL